jgi:prolyl-tRNA editing enzyme YbaK/EbsC (Cys-tRNA(Pro) deacylase)
VCTIYEPEGRLDLARATYHAIDNRPTRVVGALWEDRFRVIEHTPEGRSNLVAGVRGTTIAQGVKAVVCAIPVEGRERYVLAVLPGDRRVDTKRKLRPSIAR